MHNYDYDYDPPKNNAKKNEPIVRHGASRPE